MDQNDYKQREKMIVLNGDIKYVLGELLDQGAQGGVYKATNRKTNGIVALKLSNTIPENEQRVLRLFIQAQNSMSFNVRVLEMFQYQSFHCVVMEYADGGNLYNFLTTNQEINDKQDMMKQIASGVQELHKLNLIHRDIKPENVVIFSLQDGKRVYKLYDICLIKIQAPDFLDAVGIGSGTPSFQAPEMIDSMNYGQEVDIWALGILFYEIQTKCRNSIFQGGNENEIYSQIRAYEHDPTEIQDQISELGLQSNLTQLLISMLNPQPQLRPNITKVIQKLEPQIIIKRPSQPIIQRIVIRKQVLASGSIINTPKDQSQSQVLLSPIRIIPQLIKQEQIPINGYRNIIESHKSETDNLYKQISELKKDLQRNSDKLHEEKEKLQIELKDAILNLSNEIMQKKVILSDQAQQLHFVKQQLADRDQQLNAAKQQLADQDRKIHSGTEQLAYTKQKLQSNDEELNLTLRKLQDLQQQLYKVQVQENDYEQISKEGDNQDQGRILQKEGIQYFNIEEPFLSQKFRQGESLKNNLKFLRATTMILLGFRFI